MRKMRTFLQFGKGQITNNMPIDHATGLIGGNRVTDVHISPNISRS